MIEQLKQLIDQFGEQDIVKNPNIPNELNDQVKEETGNAITEGLQGLVKNGNLDMITGFLKGNNNSASSNPIFDLLSQQVVGQLGSKLKIDKNTAENVAGNMIPNVLGSLLNQAKDPNVKGFELSDLVGMISGNDTNAKGNLLQQLGSSVLDQNNDGKVDLNDAMSALSGKGGLGSALGGLFGKK
jgi:hypothetical protein